MKVRYKQTHTEADASQFNTHAMAEVLTGDDSAFISELEVWLTGRGCWKDMGQAFRDYDIIPDNHHVRFAEPITQEDRERGYFR